MINTLLTLFSFGAGLSSILVITSTVPIGSVIALILAFINSIGVLFILALDYLALIYTIVYVGAIAILFLFIIMLLAQTPELNKNAALSLKLQLLAHNSSISQTKNGGGLLGLSFASSSFKKAAVKGAILQKSYFITITIISILAIYSIWCGLFYIMNSAHGSTTLAEETGQRLATFYNYDKSTYFPTTGRGFLALTNTPVYTALHSIISNEQKTDMGRYGKLLYTGDYAWLIGISLILLIGMIGLITIILKNKKQEKEKL